MQHLITETHDDAERSGTEQKRKGNLHGKEEKQ